MNQARPVPQQYSASAIPYLNVTDGHGALRYYEEAFGAERVLAIDRGDGQLAHGEVKIAGATVMVRDELPELDFLSPATVGGVPLQLLVYVADLPAFVERAAAAGTRIVRPITEQFHGDLMAVLEDPYGFTWFFAMRTEDLSHDELAAKAEEWGL